MGNDTHVGPWDDGILKLAVEVALCVPSSSCAVSNAVPWSRVDENGKSLNPSSEMEEYSVQFWARLLPVLNPNKIVLAGKVAREVLHRATLRANLAIPFIEWRLPAPTSIRRISGMFSTEDLLRRYPEVKMALQNQPSYDEKTAFYRDLVYYACHALSLSEQAIS